MLLRQVGARPWTPRFRTPITWIGWMHFYFGNQLKHKIQLHRGYRGAAWTETCLLQSEKWAR